MKSQMQKSKTKVRPKVSAKTSSHSTHNLALELVEELFAEAYKAQKKSHSPYSGYKIGASILTADGDIYTGANVENSSYGATVCAERVAIWSAITDLESTQKGSFIDVVCVVSSSPEAWPPCGMCRQVISEFAHKDTIILSRGIQGETKSYTFAELFPESFNAKFLAR